VTSVGFRYMLKSTQYDIAKKEGDGSDRRCLRRAYRTYQRPHLTTLDCRV